MGEADLAGNIHHYDHGLVSGIGIGGNDHRQVAPITSCLQDRPLEHFRLCIHHFLLIYIITAFGINSDIDRLCLFIRLFILGDRFWQIDPDAGLFVKGGRYHEKYQQQKHNVDQRRQVELDIVSLLWL